MSPSGLYTILCADPEGVEQGGGSRSPLGKSQVTIGILRKTGTDHLEKHLDPLGPIASRGRSVQPSVKIR